MNKGCNNCQHKGGNAVRWSMHSFTYIVVGTVCKIQTERTIWRDPLTGCEEYRYEESAKFCEQLNEGLACVNFTERRKRLKRWQKLLRVGVK